MKHTPNPITEYWGWKDETRGQTGHFQGFSCIYLPLLATVKKSCACCVNMKSPVFQERAPKCPIYSVKHGAEYNCHHLQLDNPTGSWVLGHVIFRGKTYKKFNRTWWSPKTLWCLLMNLFRPLTTILKPICKERGHGITDWQHQKVTIALTQGCQSYKP